MNKNNQERNSLRGAKVLVTGVAGFIGSHVAEHCLELGMIVVGVDDLSGGFLENVPAGVVFVRADLSKNEELDRVWLEGPFTYVYHLAAYAAEGLSHFIRRFNYSNNLIASVNILNRCVLGDVRCLVFTSSIAVYGRGQVPMTEEMVPIPEDPYGIAKYAFELDLKAAHEMFGLNYIIFRPHNVYGERQNIGDKYRNVIGIFMNQMLKDEAMTIFGDGSQTRAFSHIDDVAPIISSAPSFNGCYNEAFNIGADIPYSVNQLAEEVSEAFGREKKINYLEARLEVQHAFSSHSKVQAAFGSSPSVSLKDGIKRMADWSKRRGQMTPTRFEGIEILRKLPRSWL